ncbi:hypothetical protein [Zavarzinia sp.]|uniref:hypothetical protein n=1 Tax=Zavarzinia sp. TaxID=2027920 RepID=UPI003BB7425B
MRKRIGMVAIVAALLATGGMMPTSAAFAAEKPILGDMKIDNDPAVAVVRDALVRFQRMNGHWPASFDELVAATASSPRPVDPGAFMIAAYSTRRQGASSIALFEFTMAGSGARGAFAVSFLDIR